MGRTRSKCAKDTRLVGIGKKVELLTTKLGSDAAMVIVVMT